MTTAKPISLSKARNLVYGIFTDHGSLEARDSIIDLLETLYRVNHRQASRLAFFAGPGEPNAVTVDLVAAAIRQAYREVNGQPPATGMKREARAALLAYREAISPEPIPGQPPEPLSPDDMRVLIAGPPPLSASFHHYGAWCKYEEVYARAKAWAESADNCRRNLLASSDDADVLLGA